MNINIITLGCSKNTVDSENIASRLKAQGHNVAFDADGNAIATGSSTNWQSLYPIKEGKQMSFRLFISVSDYDAARWARLQKIVIMDDKSEAFKQAEEQIKANKDAFKNKDKEKE